MSKARARPDEIEHNVVVSSLVKHASKSALAKLLAGENIIVQHDPSMRTAAFDVKNRILILPVWKDISNELYDFLLGHETSHALWTPSNWDVDIKELAEEFDTKEGYLQSYFNIIEDSRIDRMMKQKYRGLARDYRIGYKELFDKDFFGIEERKLDPKETRKEIKDYFLIDRINLYFKVGNLTHVPFNEAEQDLVDEIAKARTWADVKTCVRKAWELSKKEMEDWDQELADRQPGEGEGGEGEGKGEKGEGKGEGQSGPGITEFDHVYVKNDPDGDGEDEGQDGEEGDNKGDVKSNVGGAGPGFTQDVWDTKIQQTIVHVSHRKIDWISHPTVKTEMTKHYVHGHDPVYRARKEAFVKGKPNENFIFQEAIIKEAKQTIGYMVQQFERFKAADEYKKTGIAKTGKLNMNRIHAATYHDDVFLRREIHPTGKNHGFVFFLDWSGSMSGQLEGVIKQLAYLCMFCRRVNIPFDVYSFHSKLWGAENDAPGLFEFRKGDAMYNQRFCVKNILSSDMKPNVFMSALKMMMHPYTQTIDGLGGTPLNSTILLSEKIVGDFVEKYKVQCMNVIFLTDGFSDQNNGIFDEEDKTEGTSTRRQDKVASKLFIDRTHNAVYDEEVTETDGLLRTMKNRIGRQYPKLELNTIGFFLNSSETPFFNQKRDKKLSDQDEMSWRKFGFIKDDDHPGYDEHYILKASVFARFKTVGSLSNKSFMSIDDLNETVGMINTEKRCQRTLIDQYMKKLCDFG